MPKKAGTATVSLAGKLDHRAVPYTAPMKAVPQECGSLGRFRPALRLFRGAHGLICPTFPVRAMRRTGPAVPPLRSRQSLLRSGVSARGQAEARRRAAERYQRSRGGRMAHAQRSRCFRQRQYQRRRLVAASACTSPDANNVTHHGSPPGVASAPLAVWTHTTSTFEPDDATAVAPTVTATHTTVEATAGAASTAASPQCRVATHAWRCVSCGARQPAAVRLGFVRHGRPIRWRHDPAP